MRCRGVPALLPSSSTEELHSPKMKSLLWEELKGKSSPSLQTWYYTCCSGWEVSGICFLGMTQVPLFYPKSLASPTPAEKPQRDTDEVVSIFADTLLDAE